VQGLRLSRFLKKILPEVYEGVEIFFKTAKRLDLDSLSKTRKHLCPKNKNDRLRRSEINFCGMIMQKRNNEKLINGEIDKLIN